jgi:intracellular septation protein
MLGVVAALIELLPLVIFFVAFKIFGIFVATGAAMAMVLLQVGMRLLRKQVVPPAQWGMLAVVLVLGGATLLFKNEMFIKWKPTAVYWLLAVALVVGQLVFKRNFVREALSKTFDAPDSLWGRLLTVWIVFFLALGLLNVYVAYTFSTDTWTTFKVIGTMGITVTFLAGQTALLWRYVKPNA